MQHIRAEDPGHIGDLLRAGGHRLDVAQLDEGDVIPAADGYDGMICMGGPMDTCMETEHPWLAEEKRRIREFATVLRKPFLGFCLGCQLLGEALGGRVVRSRPPEIGVLDVRMHAGEDPLLGGFPQTVPALQWHSWEVAGLEEMPGVAHLASSPSAKYQAFRYQSHAYGIQFHSEIRANTVRDWGAIPEYKSALEKELGEGALAKMEADASARMKEMNRCAEQITAGFCELMQNSAARG